MGNNGEPVQRHIKPVTILGHKPFAPQTSDEFDSPELGLQWQWHANHRGDWYSLTTRPGWLRLYPQLAVNPLNEQPNLLLQKFPARSFEAETGLQFFPVQQGEEAGLIIVGEKSIGFGIQHDGLKNWLVLHTDERVEKVRSIASGQVRLRVVVRDGGRCNLSFSEGGEFIAVPQGFQATKGKWIGAKLGIYNIKSSADVSFGSADFDYFRLQ
jgi:beta-xylosidase